ncbi:MAG: type 4a pilus biogenesis protein PilO [Candidatus Omnitrophota bacterium]|nr:type 4a pilus biogenesis protein PilO [Candidatus Omnitrophota bacterium]
MAELTPQQQKQMRLLAAVLSVVGGFFWLQLLIIPQTRTAGRQGSELTVLRSKVERMRRDLQHLPEMEKKRAELAARYSSPSVSGPPEEQLPGLLDRIAQFARTAHVRVVTLRSKQDLAQVQVGPSGYLEIPLELVATAGYHQVGRFLDQLEQSDSLVRLRELEIHPGKELWDQEIKMLLLAFLAPGPEAAQE